MVSYDASAIALQGLQVSIDMLKSEVLIENVGGELILKYFPIERLPKDPVQRFKQLFAVRPKWQLADLEPFLAGLQVGSHVPVCHTALSVTRI